jgi:hypothetical protein
VSLMQSWIISVIWTKVCLLFSLCLLILAPSCKFFSTLFFWGWKVKFYLCLTKHLAMKTFFFN